MPNEELDLITYWNIIRRNLVSIFALCCVGAIAAIFVAFSITPIYSSTARLLIEAEQANVVSIEEIYGVDATQREYYQTQFEILSSRNLAKRVISELSLLEHPEYRWSEENYVSPWRRMIPGFEAAKPSDRELLQMATDKFSSNLLILPIKNTQIVDISVESIDPELAATVANALAESYINSGLEARLEVTQKASVWLTERLETMRQELELAERELRVFQEQENLVDVEGVQTLTARELDELTRRLVEAEKATAAAEAQLDAVRGGTATYSSAWESLPVVLSDQLAQSLKSAEASQKNRFDEVAKRYGPKHPNFKAAETQYLGAVSAHEERVVRVVRGLGDRYRQAVADQRALNRAINNAKQEVQDINRKSYQLSQLERAVETNRQLYDLFFQRFRETNQADFAAANARFIDYAEQPSGPVRPRKFVVVTLITALFGFLGVVIAFLRAALNNTIRIPEEVEEKLHQVVLGTVPLEKLDPGDAGASQLYKASGHDTFAESIRSVRTGLVLAGIEADQQIVVVTSSIPGEGKTTVASNLALAFGQLEKVLLIDADMRRPSLAKEYGIERGTTGLSEIVAGTASVADSINSFYGIDVLSSGAIPPNPLDLLSSSRFEELLTKLKTHYERIIIDSAPTQAVSDSMVLSQKADGLIYIVNCDATHAGVVRTGLQRLEQVRAPITGVVLNRYDPRVAESYGYYGGYGKYSYS